MLFRFPVFADLQQGDAMEGDLGRQFAVGGIEG
jgi:hypothetical protein